MHRLISFDYAIKYLLKSKADYDIVEGFISALLKEGNYKPVKIKALLDSESNKEDKRGKRAVADLVVGDEAEAKYIVEIERSEKYSFVHKACFNSSRLIVDSIDAGRDYTNIIKVFHINLLYFEIGEGNLYHGKTLIRDIETDKRLEVHMKDKKGKIYDVTNILPEYFIISVPAFKGKVKKDIDEWLYMMKHEEIKPEFKSPHIQKAAERLAYIKMSPEEQAKYDKYKFQLVDEREAMDTATQKGIEIGIKKGKEEGKEEGKIEGKMEIARKMLEDKLPLETISKYSGLTIIIMFHFVGLNS